MSTHSTGNVAFMHWTARDHPSLCPVSGRFVGYADADADDDDGEILVVDLIWFYYSRPDENWTLDIYTAHSYHTMN